MVALASLATDWWLISLRCALSPPMDPSRLGFGVFMQCVGVLTPLIAIQFRPDAKTSNKIVLASLLCAVLAFPMVRTSALLSDTITDKFYPSAGYRCPGFLR